MTNLIVSEYVLLGISQAYQGHVDLYSYMYDTVYVTLHRNTLILTSSMSSCIIQPLVLMQITILQSIIFWICL
jgi:hypothetical protein